MRDHVLRPFRPVDAAAVHRLHAQHAVADLVDIRSTVEPALDPDGVRRVFETADWAVVARDAAGSPVGWGSLRSWTEDDGTRVYLTDGYVAPPARRRGLGGRLLRESEAVAARLAARAATVDDARPLLALAARVWAGRPFFTLPAEDRFRDWLRRSDLSLFQVATVDERVVGFVAASRTPARVEIEDVQVDPGFQRRGLATAMLTRTLAMLAERDAGPVRLHTEGHDPAGARSLYERLGFQVVREYHRYRKPLGR